MAKFRCPTTNLPTTCGLPRRTSSNGSTVCSQCSESNVDALAAGDRRPSTPGCARSTNVIPLRPLLPPIPSTFPVTVLMLLMWEASWIDGWTNILKSWSGSASGEKTPPKP